jgi:cardiolipin synthase
MKNNINLFVNGKESFGCIIENIKKVSNKIEINMFIWRDDYIGNLIAEELIKAANRGVKIIISKDKLGSVFEYAEEHRQSFFHKKYDFFLFFQAYLLNIIYPMRGKSKSQKQINNEKVNELINHKNIIVYHNVKKEDHSKYYIFDNEVLIMGGVNIEDKELLTDVENKKYHDYMIEFIGSSYIEKFRKQMNGEIINNEEPEIDFIFNIKNGKVKQFEMKERIIDLLSKANKSVYIVMAYLGDEDIEKRIIELANNNIKVVIITSDKSNLQHDLNMSVLKRIMEKTSGSVNIYLSSSMVHAKLIRIDNKYVTIGSTNLNQSINKLQELNAVIELNDDIFSKKLEESINNEIRISKKILKSSELKYNKVKAIFENII